MSKSFIARNLQSKASQINAPVLLSNLDISIPSRLSRHKKYTPFAKRFSQSNLGRYYAPLNRMLSNYNSVPNSHTRSGEHNGDSSSSGKRCKSTTLDIFYNALTQFKELLSLILNFLFYIAFFNYYYFKYF